LRKDLDVGAARQVVVVMGAEMGSSDVEVTLWELNSEDSWVSVAQYPGQASPTGFVEPSAMTDENLYTPAGSYALSAAFGSAGTLKTGLPYTKLEKGDCWIATPGRDDYNRWIRTEECGERDVNLYAGASDQNGASSKYAVGAVIAYGYPLPSPYKGSGVFLQVQVAGAAPIHGVALAEDDLRRLLSRLDIAQSPRIVMGSKDYLFGASDSVPTDGTLRLGAIGSKVSELQRLLTDAGFETKVDGYFGPKTEASVKRFQQTNDLTVDGVVGPRTAQELGLEL
jgi:L,D-peptidoglycan transpeptidase YkuD (ErfK/YbiS/YcfS/YnhG family)